MFKVRKEQMEAYREGALRDFEDRVLTHLRKFYPAEHAALGEEQIRRLVRYGVARARSHGFTSERAACIYIDVMFAFGRDFDRDPALPWANQVLSREDLDGPRERAVCLFARAYQHRDEARGVGAEAALP